MCHRNLYSRMLKLGSLIVVVVFADDFFLFIIPKNHLIVKVPPYQNQVITSKVCVGIYVVTNAGRSHDVQPFTYTPDPGLFESVSH